MKILTYGAGNMGSLYAALLGESREEVSILARGRRLAQIRERGIELEDVVSAKRRTVADELRALAKTASVPTPAMDRLYRYLDPAVEPAPDGSADLPRRWLGVCLCALGVLGFPTILIWTLWRWTT